MKDKIVIITVDGNMKTVEVDKVELWVKMAAVTFTLKEENIQVDLLADMSEELGADSVFIMHDDFAQEKNIVANSLAMAQYTPPAAAFLTKNGKTICGDAAIVAWKDDGLMPAETVKAALIPYIKANQLAKAFFEEKQKLIHPTVEICYGEDVYFKRP